MADDIPHFRGMADALEFARKVWRAREADEAERSNGGNRHKVDGLPEDWRQRDSFGSWQEAVSELRRRRVAQAKPPDDELWTAGDRNAHQ
jgi:hypothetical protein